MNPKEKHLSTTTAANQPLNGFGNINDLIINNTDVIYLLVDTQYTVRATNASNNPKVKLYLNQNIQVGTIIFNLVPEPQRPALKEIYDKVFTGQQFTVEREYQNDGSSNFYRIMYKPVYEGDGTIVGALVTIYDITVIKNKERALQLSEERWRFALEGSNQGLWDWNVATGEVYFSYSWKKLFGFLEEDGINHIDQWFERLHPEDLKSVRENLENHFNSEDPHFESVYRFKAKAGDYRWLLSRGVVLEKDEAGKPLRMIGTHTDITQLHLLEQNYKTLFDANPLASWTYHLDTGRFLDVNQAALQLYGYTRSEFLCMTVMQLLPNKEETQKGKETFFQSGHYQQHCKKNGAIITVNITSHTLEMQNGKVALVLAEEVTQKAAAEQALFDSNERFKLASMATSDAIYDWDLEKKRLNWSDGLYPLFGYRAHQVTLQNWEAYVHPDEQEDVLKSLYKTIENPRKKKWIKEYRFKPAHGNYRYVIEKGFIIRDATGKAIRMIGALQDITDLKQKQIELQKSNERFDAVIQATNDFIWDWNLELNTFYIDRSGLKKVLGVENPNSIADEEMWLQRLHPADQPKAREVINNIMNGTIDHNFEREYRFKRDDGTYAFIHDRGIVLRNKQGQPVRLIGAAQDITIRKKLERELVRKELEKQKIISKATIDAQEQERSEIGRELHDNVNQVLTTTKLYLELAGLKPEMKEEMIKKSSENILYVINEIRQLSRSLMNPSIGDLGLMDAINDLVDSINTTKKLFVKLNTDGNVEDLLSADLKLMVYRILQEALNNALRHSRASKVLISIKKKEKNIELIVQDDGVGFDLEGVKKGIGLKNIENRVYLANGRLQIKSARGSGFSLIVHFPYKN